MTQETLPDGYPHERAIYVYGEPHVVELLGARPFTFTPEQGSGAGEELTSLRLAWCWFDPEPDEYKRDAGVREEELQYFQADGGINAIYDALRALPERRVDGGGLL